MLSYYGGNQPGQTPGVFNQIQGYYWWMAGAAWNVLPLHISPYSLGDNTILVAHRRRLLQRFSLSSNAVLPLVL